VICVSCGTIEGPKKGASEPCSSCGEPLRRETRDNIKLATEAMALARVRELVEEWVEEGLIDRPSALRIHDRISRAKEEPEPPPPLPPPPVAPPPQTVEVEVEPEVFAGVGTLAALDAVPEVPREPGKWETEVRPLLYENVGWFIGTLLILAGSIYGVREAWRTLGGIARHVTVGGALFAYHALFVGLAALLARKSVTTGKVLASIALGLLPMVFVALSSALQVSVPAGALIGLVFAAGALLTTRSAAKRLEVEEPLTLALLFVPSLVAELPLAVTAPDSWARVAIPFVGVAAVAVAGRSSLGTELAAVYSAIALGLFALVGGPDDAARGAIAEAGFGLFAATFAAAIAFAAERPRTREEHPRATAVMTVIALAVLLVAALRVLPALIATLVARDLAFAHAVTMTVLVATFAYVARRRMASLHVAAMFAPVAGLLVVRAAMPDRAEGWSLGVAGSVAVSFVAGRFLDDRARRILVGWGVVTAIAALGVAPVLETAARSPGAYVFTTATAATIALSAHYAADVRRRGLHYLGGVAAIVAAIAWLGPLSIDPARTLGRMFFVVSAAFAALAFAFDARAAADEPKRARPFDDLSSFALWGALVASLPTLRSGPTLFAMLQAEPAFALVAVGFAARGVRDRTALGSLIGAGVLGVLAISRVNSPAQFAFVTAMGALILATLAATRGTAADEHPIARHVFGVIPLPYPARRARAIPDGLAIGAWIATALSVLGIFVWMVNRDEPERALAVQAGAVLVATQVVGFALPSFGRFGMRGSVAGLSLATTLVGLAAVANRIGRPLPPPVVGLKLTLVAIGIWALARLAAWKGPSLGRALGDEVAGRSYHVVFHTVVGLLGAVLLVDAWLIGGASPSFALVAIPPTMLIGAAIATVLLAWSFRAAWLLHLAAPIALGAAALVATQHSVLGSVIPMAIPDGDAWGRALIGPATLGVAFAIAATTFARRDDAREQPLAIWTAIVAATIAALGFFRAEVTAAVLVAAAGGALLLSKRRRLARAVVACGAILVVHALAQTGVAIPTWTGPAIAAFASIALMGRDDESRSRGVLDLLAAGALGIAFIYSLAEGARPDPVFAGGAVVAAAVDALDARWLLSLSLPITASIAGCALFVTGARSRAGLRSYVAHIAAAALLALAAITVTCAVHRAIDPSQWRWAMRLDLTTWIVRALGPAIACTIALLAALHQLFAMFASAAGRPNGPLRLSRDLLLVATGAVGTAFVLAGRAPLAPSPGSNALLIGAGAIAIAAATAAHVAFRERSSKHVYFVQLAVVATYGLFRSELLPRIAPELDAVFALSLGFLLLGVTVQARRAAIPEIATSTRTFAALLPIAVALILPHRASMSAAVIAAASGALYGALAWVERSRFLGSLGAAACNLALLFLAMSNGINGREIHLAALGLFVLALGHMFASTMEHGARTATRIVGGAILYVPAAYRLAGDLGNAANGEYSVAFGAACLVGILAGMVLHIRAYLAFGTGFLVLDVIANLAAAGLRDHRVGFLVLSLAGLGILGMMVFVTLKRDLVRATSARLRLALRGWD
jgi:hypothetical protein